MCKNWLKNSHPFGKKCQKTAGGIFLTHTVVQSWHGCRNRTVMKTGREWLLVESSKLQDRRQRNCVISNLTVDSARVPLVKNSPVSASTEARRGGVTDFCFHLSWQFGSGTSVNQQHGRWWWTYKQTNKLMTENFYNEQNKIPTTPISSAVFVIQFALISVSFMYSYVSHCPLVM